MEARAGARRRGARRRWDVAAAAAGSAHGGGARAAVRGDSQERAMHAGGELGVRGCAAVKTWRECERKQQHAYTSRRAYRREPPREAAPRRQLRLEREHQAEHSMQKLKPISPVGRVRGDVSFTGAPKTSTTTAAGAARQRSPRCGVVCLP